VIVVSDTTPLNYAILIGQIDGNPPAWLEIRDIDFDEESGTVLDAGELAAPALAELLHANILLMDDRRGYEEAVRRDLRAVGTLGVLAEAASQKLIDLPKVLEHLRQTNFFISPQVLQSLTNRFNKPKVSSGSALKRSAPLNSALSRQGDSHGPVRSDPVCLKPMVVGSSPEPDGEKKSTVAVDGCVSRVLMSFNATEYPPLVARCGKNVDGALNSSNAAIAT
jgi:hypothetical protein